MRILTRGKHREVHLRMSFDGFVSALCTIDTPIETIVTGSVDKVNCLPCLSLYLKIPMRELQGLKIEDIQTSLKEVLQASKSSSIGV